MRKFMQSNIVWYLMLAGIVTGLFAPTLVANALETIDRARCPVPAQGDVL